MANQVECNSFITHTSQVAYYARHPPIYFGVSLVRFPAKPFIVSLVTLMTFAYGAVPATATPASDHVFAEVPAVPVPVEPQSLSTITSTVTPAAISSVLENTELSGPKHGFDVDVTIAAALSEVGTSRATGWGQPGECLPSVQRWVRAGGGNWIGGGNPVSNYVGATRVTLAEVEPGDVIQYEYITSPTSWVTGVHTILIIGVNDDGTFSIVESNNPAGSGYVSANTSWTPKPPPGFEAAVWRF